MPEVVYNIEDCVFCNRCDEPVSACRCTEEELDEFLFWETLFDDIEEEPIDDDD